MDSLDIFESLEDFDVSYKKPGEKGPWGEEHIFNLTHKKHGNLGFVEVARYSDTPDTLHFNDIKVLKDPYSGKKVGKRNSSYFELHDKLANKFGVGLVRKMTKKIVGHMRGKGLNVRKVSWGFRTTGTKIEKGSDLANLSPRPISLRDDLLNINFNSLIEEKID